MSNGCHDVLMISINLNDIAILNIHRVNYCCNINGIDKSEAAKCCFNWKKRELIKIKKVEMNKEIISFGNIEIEENIIVIKIQFFISMWRY